MCVVLGLNTHTWMRWFAVLLALFYSCLFFFSFHLESVHSKNLYCNITCSGTWLIKSLQELNYQGRNCLYWFTLSLYIYMKKVFLWHDLSSPHNSWQQGESKFLPDGMEAVQTLCCGVMAQVWGWAVRPPKGSLIKVSVLQIMARNQELTLSWAATDTGITKISFGVYSIADRCATAVQPLNHVNNGHGELSWKPLKV